MWWPPRWAMHARRSLTVPAREVLVEMFMQGTTVRMAKASGGARVVVWNSALEELRACSRSQLFGAKEELIGRGYLTELPGARIAANGRRFSTWFVPIENPDACDSEYSSISDSSADDSSISIGSRVAPDSNSAPEYGSISRSSEKSPRVRARGLVTTTSKHTTTNNDFPETESSSEMSDDSLDPKRQGVGDERYSIALAGLRWAKYRDPEQALARFGVERCLVALSALAGKFDANEYVGKPGGFVFTTLLALEDREVAPVSDVGFARWWDESALPGNVRVMRK